jgi:hypothetical protein
VRCRGTRILLQSDAETYCMHAESGKRLDL